MTKYPHLGLTADEDKFVLRLWQTLQASGHLIAREKIETAVADVDRSFAPPPSLPVKV